MLARQHPVSQSLISNLGRPPVKHEETRRLISLQGPQLTLPQAEIRLFMEAAIGVYSVIQGRVLFLKI